LFFGHAFLHDVESVSFGLSFFSSELSLEGSSYDLHYEFLSAGLVAPWKWYRSRIICS